MSKKTLWFLMLLTLFFSQQILPRQDASSVNPACVSLDMVVLLDQSRSMEVNDPNNLRIEVLSNIIEYLADLSLFFCPQSSNRLAIVGFGDLSSDWLQDVRLYFNEILAPSSIADWTQTRAELYSKLPEPENLGSTDFRSAFLMAQQIFQSWDEHPLASPYPRRRVLFVVTDGGPCVVDDGCRRDDIRNYDMRQALSQIETLINQRFPWRGAASEFSVFLVGIALNDRLHDYWEIVGDQWVNIAKRRGGAFLRVPTDTPNNQGLIRRVYDLLSLIAPFPFRSALCQQDIVVAPYRGLTVAFHIWRFPEADQETPPVASLILHTPDQEVVFQNGVANLDTPYQPSDYYQPTLFSERYVFKPAIPGVYRVDAPEASVCTVEVYIAQGPEAILEISPSTELTQSPGQGFVLPVVDEPPYYSESLRPRLRVELYYQDVERQPVEELPYYPIQLCVQVIEPDGQERWYTQFSQTQPGVFLSNDFLLTPKAGTYQVRAFAFTRSPQQVIQGNLPPISDPEAFCAQATQGDLPAGWLSILTRTYERDQQIIEEIRGIETAFEARAVPLFFLRWVEPRPDLETFFLGEITPEGQANFQPITITVELYRADNQAPLDPKDLFEDPNQALQARLYPEQNPGQAVEAFLAPVPHIPGRFTVTLQPLPQWREGSYIFQVSLTGDPLKSLELLPGVRQIALQATGTVIYQVQPRIQIQAPDLKERPLPLVLLDALRGRLEPLQIQLVFQHQSENIPLDELLRTPTPLTAQVTLPDGTQTTIELRPEEEAFIGQLTQSPTLPGEYQITVNVSPLTFTPLYALPADDITTLQLTYNLQLPWYAQTNIIRALTVGLSILLVLLGVMFVKWNFSGPPGVLELRRNFQEVESWSLGMFAPMGRKRIKTYLDDTPITIVIRKVGTEEDEDGTKRTVVAIRVEEPDGVIEEGEIKAGEELSLPRGYTLVYDDLRG